MLVTERTLRTIEIRYDDEDDDNDEVWEDRTWRVKRHYNLVGKPDYINTIKWGRV